MVSYVIYLHLALVSESITKHTCYLYSRKKVMLRKAPKRELISLWNAHIWNSLHSSPHWNVKNLFMANGGLSCKFNVITSSGIVYFPSCDWTVSKSCLPSHWPLEWRGPALNSSPSSQVCPHLKSPVTAIMSPDVWKANNSDWVNTL
jgi:hypothetical protein